MNRLFLILLAGWVLFFSKSVASVANQVIPMKPACGHELRMTRDQSPWHGYTGSYAEEQAGLHLVAVPDLTGLVVPPHLLRWQFQQAPLLAIDVANRRVVVNGNLFSNLYRPDVTNLPAGKRQEIGKIHAVSALGGSASLVRFLLESQIIRTYAHLDAKVCLAEGTVQDGVFQASVTGYHSYCTNRCQKAPLNFIVGVELATGVLFVKTTGE